MIKSMKGIILAGGTGSRLYPLTRVTNKHLLPVYNRPMIYYPLFTLFEAGIKDVLIVSGKGHCGDFVELLASGKEFGMNLMYEVQDEPKGIADALSLAEDFCSNERFVVALGDNVIEDNISDIVKDFASYEDDEACVFLKQSRRPRSYGVAEVDDDRILSIEEKPEFPKSDLAVIGLYMYSSRVFDLIRKIEPSDRDELEITDLNNLYVQEGKLRYNILNGFWKDCGESFDSLHEAFDLVKASRLKDLKFG